MAHRISRSTVLVALCGALAGCGGGSHPQAAPAGASPDSSVGVIRAWAEALARGDVGAAAAYFATPSSVQIGPGEPVAVVRTAADARAVNLALPCGAKLLDARPVGGYLDALFLLMRRPGADCGAGVGGTGRVAFVIRSGKIAVWRRIADEPGDAAHAAPAFRAPAQPVPLPSTARTI